MNLLSWMFSHATSFNQSIAAWNTSAVTHITAMFEKSPFNQPLDAWDTSHLLDMNSAFEDNAAFNQPLASWDTSAVQSMHAVFKNAVAFNQPINAWSTSSVKHMDYMFQGAVAFNQSLDSWDVSHADTHGMFANALAFDTPPCSAGKVPAANGLGCAACPAGRCAFAGFAACLSCNSGWVPNEPHSACVQCGPGTVPADSLDECVDCPPGHYSWPGASICIRCYEGTAPAQDRGSCQPCPALHDVARRPETCPSCDFPRFVQDDSCVWWHLPVVGFVIAIGIPAILIAVRIWSGRKRTRNAKNVEAVMSRLYSDLWDPVPSRVEEHILMLQHAGLDSADVVKPH